MCVSKLCVSKLCVGGGREEEAAGYRSRNKNPTQRCRELVNPGVFIIRVRPIFFYARAFDLLLGPASKTNFWQYFNCVTYGNLIHIEIEQNSFY